MAARGQWLVARGSKPCAMCCALCARPMFFENFIEESKDLTSFDFKGRGNLAQTIRIVLNNKDISQVIKGTRRMTWRQEPMKDAISCEKPRGTASRF